MENEEKVERETSNPEEEKEEQQEDIEEVKQRLAKAEELAGNYKIRAEKAEAKAKTVQPAIKPQEQITELTSKDVLVLANSGITNDEDVELIERWAKFNNKPIKEALKDDMLQTVLSKKKEERQTASATQTKGGAGGSAKLSGEALLEKARRGQYPTEDADIEKMIAAKLEAKRKK